MPRIDIWDVQTVREEQPVDCGYARNFSDKFQVLYQIGKGGFGVVRCVKDVLSGGEFACKSIRKKLDVPNLSVDKQAKHIDNIKREISILRKLRGTLSVVYFKGAYEDDEYIHIVMEYCRGGELHHRIGNRKYTEQTVQRIMRACLQTLAQCHSHHILHRDIKPGNFMFLNENEDSPVKALDFGLAVYFNPDELPRSDLGLEGTPWFMSPESLQSAVVPASDVWSAGVMAYQLLSGYLPFDDKRNPNSPALSVVWKAILSNEPKFSGSVWKDISEDARDFVKQLLMKDPQHRPSAKEALNHRWLIRSEEQLPAKPLSSTVVQRIQRFNQSNLVRRSILEMIASELLEYITQMSPDPSVHGRMSRGSGEVSGAWSPMRGSMDVMMSSPQGSGGDHSMHGDPGTTPLPTFGDQRQQHQRPPLPTSKSHPMLHMAVPQTTEPPKSSAQDSGGSGDMEVEGGPVDEEDIKFKHEMGEKISRKVKSVHGGTEFLKMRKSTSHAVLSEHDAARKAHSVHGSKNFFRIMRAAAVLMNTGHSQHGPDYLHLASRNDVERTEQAKVARIALDTSAHGGKEYHRIVQQLSSLPPAEATKTVVATRTKKVSFPPPSPEGSQQGKVVDAAADMEVGRRGQGRFKAFMQQTEAVDVPPAPSASATAAVESELPPASAFSSSPSEVTRTQNSKELMKALEQLRDDSGSVSHPKQLRPVLEQMSFGRANANSSITAAQLGEGLERMGYQLEGSELNALVDQLDLNGDGHIERSEFVASQIDWSLLQEDYRDMWLECARRAFAKLDSGKDGKIDSEELIGVLKSKLPAHEVDWAMEDEIVHRGYADADEMDFEAFLKLVKSASYDSLDSLDQYESRLAETFQPHLDTIADDEK